MDALQTRLLQHFHYKKEVYWMKMERDYHTLFPGVTYQDITVAWRNLLGLNFIKLNLSSNNSSCIITKKGEGTYSEIAMLEAEEREAAREESELGRHINILTRDQLVYQETQRQLESDLKEAQLKLINQQSAELRHKRLWAAIGAIGGAALAWIVDHASAIYHFIVR